MLPFIRDLGDRIERDWSETGYDASTFADVAFARVRQASLIENLTVDQILDWFYSDGHQLRQETDLSFGEPQIKLYEGRDFYIEVLFWTTSTTSIHEHAFSGVFTVLAGSSVHSLWEFETTRRLKTTFQLGRLQRRKTELLKAGDSRRILAGRTLIHQLFHLDHPSATLVVRTRVDREHLPQLSYYPPGLGINPFDQNPVVKRQLMALGTLQTGSAELRKYAGRLAASGDPEVSFELLSAIAQSEDGDAELLAGVTEAFRLRHGDQVLQEILRVVECRKRIGRISRARTAVKGREHRFFLALLMLLPDRESILEMIRHEYPDLPAVELAFRWAVEISTIIPVGAELDELNQRLFRSALAGCTESELLESLANDYDEDELETQREELLEHARKLCSCELFRPLFVGVPLGPVPLPE